MSKDVTDVADKSARATHEPSPDGLGHSVGVPNAGGLWLDLAAAFGPILKEAFADSSPAKRMAVAETLSGVVEMRQGWFAPRDYEGLRAALEEAEEVLALAATPSFADPDYQARIEALGDQIGYGALMAGASAAWRNRAIVAGSEFVAGPCQITVTKALKTIRAALAGRQA